jgi:hypothetical protein
VDALIKLLILTTVISPPHRPSLPADWWYVSNSHKDVIAFVDKSSIIQAGPQTLVTYKLAHKVAHSSIRHYADVTAAISCSENKHSYLSSFDYDKNGKPLGTYGNVLTQSDDVMHDPIEAIFNFVCRNSGRYYKIIGNDPVKLVESRTDRWIGIYQ